MKRIKEMTKQELLNSSIKQNLLPQVVNAAVSAGQAIMQVYKRYCKREPNEQKFDYMIEANKAANETVKELLGPTRIPIFSEEGRQMSYEERCNWEMFWLVDPLDGTIEFLNETNEFTVNIALMYHGEAIIGVIYVPHNASLYYALSEGGSYLCRGIEPSADFSLSYREIIEKHIKLPLVEKPRSQQRVMLSRSHKTSEALDIVANFRQQHPNLITMEQGSSYKFCILAEGESDCYVRTSATYEWDTAAGELILSEAGGVTVAINNSFDRLIYNKENPENPWFVCHSKISKIKSERHDSVCDEIFA